MKNTIEQMISNSQYNEACELIAKEMNIGFKTKFLKNDFHFIGDKSKRDIYEITLTKDGRKYSFNFGQSLVNSGHSVKIKPSLYDVLACLQKYDVGSFDDFCGNFGYDTYSRNAEKIYKSVVEEYDKMRYLFSESELEILREIQ